MKRQNAIANADEFKLFAADFQENSVLPFAFGIGFHYTDDEDEIIAYKWATVNVQENMGAASAIMEVLDIDLSEESFVSKKVSAEDVKSLLTLYFQPFKNDGKYHENIDALKICGDACSVIFYRDEEFLLTQPIQNIADAHFRLALMSRLKYKPNTVCLDNLFGVLPNLSWGIMPARIEGNKLDWVHADPYEIAADKIPMLSWGAPVPPGVRIANPHSVRLGAYLSVGTTVMHYGFVNFNAGTLGKAMVEGRISAGTVVGDGTDIGAGAGFLGTLSGGNTVKLSTGKDCLIGAMAECGIVLGDNCVVATGTCFSGNTPFKMPSGQIVKAHELSGKPNLTFRRNAITGALEVIEKGNKAILNDTLHSGQ